MDMRGLAHFIQDIRKATTSKEEEQRRVDMELAKIRAKIVETTSMSTYNRKKYVCKLMFIAMLGYPVTFGHMEGIKLLAEVTPAEKLIGYLSITVFLHENHELLTLTTHRVYKDLLSTEDFNRSLALTAIANAGGRDFAELMHDGVKKLLMDSRTNIHIRKKAILTYLHIYRKYPEIVELEEVVPKVIELVTSPYFGVSGCAVTFLDCCMRKDNMHLFTAVPLKLVDVLSQIIIDKQTEPGYVYYGVPAPWLQSSIIRFLQRFPAPPEGALRERTIQILRKIVKATGKVLKDAQTQQKQRGTQNRVSAMNAVLFEVVSLVIHWNIGLKLMSDCADVVSSFITDKRESNYRYLGLTLLSRLSFLPKDSFDFHAYYKQYQQQIIVGLHDPDVSIRKKALQVVMTVCDKENARDIIKELVSYLSLNNDSIFLESLVLAIALLADKYCDDRLWYVDVMLAVVAQAGDFAPSEIAYDVLHLIVNDHTVQKRAATTVFQSIKSTQLPHQVMLRISAFILGEFGYQIALNPESTPLMQASLLAAHLKIANIETQAMILSALMKFYNVFDNAQTRDKIMKVFRSYDTSMSAELQQRASEYILLIESGNDELIQTVLEAHPPFEETDIATRIISSKHFENDVWIQKALEKSTGGRTSLQPMEISPPKVRLLDTPKEAVTTTPTDVAAKHAELDQMLKVTSAETLERMRYDYNQHKEQLICLLKNNEGTLFENDVLSLHCVQKYDRFDGRLVLTLSDKTGEGLYHVGFDIVESNEGLLLQARCTENEVPAGGSITIEIAARSLGPFTKPPSARLAYSCANTFITAEIFSLPILVTRFFSSYPTASEGEALSLFKKLKTTETSVSHSIQTNHRTGSQLTNAIIQYLHLMPCIPSTEEVAIAIGAYVSYANSEILYTPFGIELVCLPNAIRMASYSGSPLLQKAVIDAIEPIMEKIQ